MPQSSTYQPITIFDMSHPNLALYEIDSQLLCIYRESFHSASIMQKIPKSIPDLSLNQDNPKLSRW